MKYTETYKSLFTLANQGYTIAQTISADFGMGNPLQRHINNKYNTKQKLKELYMADNKNNACIVWDNLNFNQKGFCIYEEPVINLVVKRSWKGIPSYTSIRNALKSMKAYCDIKFIKKVVMPMIGTGEDKLCWEKIKTIIEEVFNDTDIEIVVSKYFINKKKTDNNNIESISSELEGLEGFIPLEDELELFT